MQGMWVQFKDKARQKARAKKLKEGAERQAKQAQKEPPMQPKPPAKLERRPNAAKRRLLEDRQDDYELEEEYRLLKRLRRGKMTNVSSEPHQS